MSSSASQDKKLRQSAKFSNVYMRPDRSKIDIQDESAGHVNPWTYLPMRAGPKMRSMYDTGRKVRTCTLFWKVRIIHQCTIRCNFQNFVSSLHSPMILRRILKVPVGNMRLLLQICMSEISSSWWFKAENYIQNLDLSSHTFPRLFKSQNFSS